MKVSKRKKREDSYRAWDLVNARSQITLQCDATYDYDRGIEVLNGAPSTVNKKRFSAIGATIRPIKKSR